MCIHLDPRSKEKVEDHTPFHWFSQVTDIWYARVLCWEPAQLWVLGKYREARTYL